MCGLSVNQLEQTLLFHELFWRTLLAMNWQIGACDSKTSQLLLNSFQRTEHNVS